MPKRKHFVLLVLAVGFCHAPTANASWLARRCHQWLVKHSAPPETALGPREQAPVVPVVISIIKPMDIEELMTGVEEYRTLGGMLYWKHGKLARGYGNDSDVMTYETGQVHLTELGNRFRFALQTAQLTEAQRERLVAALEDYSSFENPYFRAPAFVVIRTPPMAGRLPSDSESQQH